jgi:DNA-binding transcriptional MerR regulator
MNNKSLSIDINEKDRILFLHKILNEQQSNPNIVNQNDYINLARTIINANLCNFSNFNGWSNETKSTIDKPTPYQLKNGKIGILGKAKTDDQNKTYKAGQFVFFNLDNIGVDQNGNYGNLTYFVQGNLQNGYNYYCQGLNNLIKPEIDKIIGALTTQGFKSPDKFTPDEQSQLENSNMYNKLDFIAYLKQYHKNINPAFYNTLGNRYRFFYRSKISPSTKALTDAQKQVINRYEQAGYLTKEKINPAEIRNYTQVDLSRIESTIFSEPFFMYAKTGAAKNIVKGYKDNSEILQNIKETHGQCLNLLNQFENLLATYRNDIGGDESLRAITNKIQYCYNKYGDKKFGKKLESLGVIGDYANVPDVFKIKR